MRLTGMVLVGLTLSVAASCRGTSRDFDDPESDGGAGDAATNGQAAGAPSEPAASGGADDAGGGPTAGSAGSIGTAGAGASSSDGGAPPIAPECGAALATDRRNCGECDNVCFAPSDCSKGKCAVCANGCAVLSAKLTSAKPRASFSLGLVDYFDPPANPITMTAWLASGSKVVVSLVLVYEEGGTTDVNRTFDTNDWITLSVQGKPAMGPIAFVDVRFHELGAFKGTTELYLEEVTGVPNHDFEFERSAMTIETYPVFLSSGDQDPDYIDGTVNWLGPN